uniref:hypothetical protein n=1 Tax=Tardiphaga sp. TaxID=1926292 RepID=UPI0037D9BB35
SRAENGNDGSAVAVDPNGDKAIKKIDEVTKGATPIPSLPASRLNEKHESHSRRPEDSKRHTDVVWLLVAAIIFPLSLAGVLAFAR